jgi:hypothetical protein
MAVRGRIPPKLGKTSSFFSFDDQAKKFFEHVTAFRNGVAQNKHITLAIKLRRFELLKALEKGVSMEEQGGYTGPVHIVWEKLVQRMAAYALDRSRMLSRVKFIFSVCVYICMVYFNSIGFETTLFFFLSPALSLWPTFTHATHTTRIWIRSRMMVTRPA